MKGVLGRLRLLGLAHQLHKAGGDRSLAQDSQQVSTEIDAHTQEEVLAACPASGRARDSKASP